MLKKTMSGLPYWIHACMLGQRVKGISIKALDLRDMIGRPYEVAYFFLDAEVG